MVEVLRSRFCDNQVCQTKHTISAAESDIFSKSPRMEQMCRDENNCVGSLSANESTKNKIGIETLDYFAQKAHPRRRWLLCR
jgi:hypothetical protein